MTRAPRRVDTLHHTSPAAAQALLDLLALTHAQEAQALGLARPPVFNTTQASRAFYLGAWVGEDLVGALALGPDSEAGQLAIQTLVVHPGHQRQGHGLALLRNLLQRAGGMTLSVVAGAANAGALALYRGQGFEVYRQGWLTVGNGGLAGGPAGAADPVSATAHTESAGAATDQAADQATSQTAGVLMLKMRRTATP